MQSNMEDGVERDLSEHRKRLVALEAGGEGALHRALESMRGAQSEAKADALDTR